MTTAYRLAVVGGGPRATYALERLSATLHRLGSAGRLDVRVFERCGEFGAGAAHSSAQARTSYLNRTTNQVGFAADETVTGAGPLRPAAERPTLYEWCRRRFTETGEPDFDVDPQNWPKRYVHGLALRDMFDRWVRDLRADPRVTVHLHTGEVVDVDRGPIELTVRTANGDQYAADEVLLLTGHVEHDPRRSPTTRAWHSFARSTGAGYVSYPYPLDRRLASGTARVVGVAGMGLTAIDVILHLTEGRGGRFIDDPPGGLTYRASGREPATIVAFGGAGVFTYTRPDNRKEDLPDNAEHHGVFLTRGTVDELRKSVGVAPAEGVRAQLDFDRHVLPVLLLEMAYLHYTTLFGAGMADLLVVAARPRFEAFLAGDTGGCDAADPRAAGWLAAPVETAIDEVAAVLTRILAGTEAVEAAQAAHRRWPVGATLDRWVEVVFGAAATGSPSPWRLETDPTGNRFDWWRTINPIAPADSTTPSAYRAALLDFMDRDQRWAEQGNLDNPHKAAADGVWRDLRPMICYAIDDAGVTAQSQQAFLATHARHHNRLANGAAPEVMAKIRALVQHGVLDVGTGPGARVTTDAGSAAFRVDGPVTGASRLVDTLVEARVPPFDPRLDAAPLYRNLLAAGTVRLWRNTSADGSWYEPGGLDVTAAFHPIIAAGTIERRITVLGPPTEGARSFLLSALRPGRNHYVLRDTLVWLEEFWDSFEGRAVPCSTPSPASLSATGKR